MSKWVLFYHEQSRFDFVNMRFTDEKEIVAMIGVDSIMPIDGRWNMQSIHAAIQKRIESMKNIESFDPCAFSIISGLTILCASESSLYSL